MAATFDSEQVRATLARRQRAIEAYLEAFFTAHLALAEISPETHHLLDALRGFVLAGGGRLGGCLVATGYTCLHPEPADDHLVTAGAAVELLHAFRQTHDDIVDRARTRHGAPALHRQFAADLARRFPAAGERYGGSLAVLAGDVAAALTFEALATLQAEPSRLLPAVQKLATVGAEASYGGALDVLTRLAAPAAEAEILRTYRQGTAGHSLEGPLHIGAILAGAGPDLLDALSAFAVPFGVAYQIKDDLIGIFGGENLSGTSVGGDLRQGKQALLIAHALHGPYAEQLRPMLDGDALDAPAIDRARSYLRDGGSAAYAEKHIGDLLAEATGALARLRVRPEAAAFLRGLLSLLIGRVA